MAITVTKQVSAPTNLQAALVAGGSLLPSTTYYFIVIAYDQEYMTPGTTNRHPNHSDISAEGNFTTTVSDLSVKITWNNIPEHSAGVTRYQILLTMISGDYSEAGGYKDVLLENLGTILDGPTGYTITALSTSLYCFHSIQLKNSMDPDITNDLGMIFVEFSGTSIHDLDDVYDAIVAAGLSAYAKYDGYSFMIKGWFYVNSTELGSLVVEKKRLIFLKGGIQNVGTGYIFRFGRWQSELVGANYAQGCDIDMLSGRYAFSGSYPGRLQVYGCRVHTNEVRNLTIPEYVNPIYYNGASGNYLTRDTSEIKDSIFSMYARGNTSDVRDLKWAQGNNWGNVNHIRLNIYSSPNMPYSAGLGVFYACKWNIFAQTFSIYTFVGRPLNFTEMFDCEFPSYPGGMIDKPYVRFYVNNNDPPTSFNYILNHYSIAFTVLDVDGNPIEGVTVNAVDGLGDPAEWIENDGTYDKLVTGNKYTTARLTDVDGQIDYYVKAYKNYLNPDNTENISNYSSDTFKDDYYPYTVIFSKDGYESYSVKILTLNEPVTGVVTLQETSEDPSDSGLTNAYETETMRHLFLNEPILNIGDAGGMLPSVVSGDLFVALLTASPGETGVMDNEATFTGYTRIPVPRGATGWSEFLGKVRNVNQVNFPENQGGLETISHYAIMKELTGTEMVCYGALDDPIDVDTEGQLQFLPTQMEFNID